jgi:hypothetical protein
MVLESWINLLHMVLPPRHQFHRVHHLSRGLQFLRIRWEDCIVVLGSLNLGVNGFPRWISLVLIVQMSESGWRSV